MVTGTTSDTNPVNSGVITASFPATSDAVINIATIPGVTPPALGEMPVTTITATGQYTGTVTWSPAVATTFLGSQVYTATITLTAKSGYTLTGVVADFFTVTGSTSNTNQIDSGVVTVVFPATGVTPPSVINIAAIPGVTAPVVGVAPETTITPTDQYTGTVAWSPAVASTFLGSQAYTATITLTAKSGYTLNGVAANFFTVTGTTSDSNPVNSGVITAVFTATAAAVINIAAIPGVTAPVVGAAPASAITETTQYTGTVIWSGTPVTFAAATAYTATITLTAKAGFTLIGVAANFFTVTDAMSDTNLVNSGVITAAFPATAAADITAAGVTGFVAPVTDATNQTVGALTRLHATYSITSLTWNPTTTHYTQGTAYTATVVLTSAEGYKFPAGGITVPTATAGGVTVSAGTTSGGNISGNTLSFDVSFPATISDASFVATDKAALAITFSSGDSETGVSQNITLPTTGSNGTTISWTSANAAVTTSGVVTRPNGSDSSGNLTATITRGSASDTKVFAVTVKATGTSGITVGMPSAPGAADLIFRNSSNTVITSFNVTKGATVTVNTAFVATSFAWYIDNGAVSVSTAASCPLVGNNYSLGLHTLLLIAQSGGKAYSGRIQFTVVTP